MFLRVNNFFRKLAQVDKLHVIADYEGRSANSQILVLIRDLIEAYEQKHGEIKTGKRS